MIITYYAYHKNHHIILHNIAHFRFFLGRPHDTICQSPRSRTDLGGGTFPPLPSCLNHVRLPRWCDRTTMLEINLERLKSTDVRLRAEHARGYTCLICYFMFLILIFSQSKLCIYSFVYLLYIFNKAIYINFLSIPIIVYIYPSNHWLIFIFIYSCSYFLNSISILFIYLGFCFAIFYFFLNYFLYSKFDDTILFIHISMFMCFLIYSIIFITRQLIHLHILIC